MNSQELLQIIVCPKTKQSLRPAAVSELKSINDQILLAQITYSNGALATKPLSGLLITSDGNFGYEIIEDIPVLLEEKAIILSMKNV
jgi:uncharacterized protein